LLALPGEWAHMPMNLCCLIDLAGMIFYVVVDAAECLLFIVRGPMGNTLHQSLFLHFLNVPLALFAG